MLFLLLTDSFVANVDLFPLGDVVEIRRLRDDAHRGAVHSGVAEGPESPAVLAEVAAGVLKDVDHGKVCICIVWLFRDFAASYMDRPSAKLADIESCV